VYHLNNGGQGFETHQKPLRDIFASMNYEQKETIEISELNVVTGAFSFTGKHITQRLLSMGKRVKTLTGHHDRAKTFEEKVAYNSFNFDNKKELIKSLRGAITFYNTYWIRFPYGQVTFDNAIENSKKLITAAEEAGVRRIVHISIANASEKSPFPYYRAKAIVERAIMNSSLSYAIIRPTVLFGYDDILFNNIAWLLRKFPIFAIFGSGDYRLQPVFVDDVAELAVGAGNRDDNIIIDAAGPEIYSFENIVKLIAEKIHSRSKIIHLRPFWVFLLSRLAGYVVNDMIVTRDEMKGLMSNLLVSKSPPTAQTRLSEWLDQNAEIVGTKYASELNRHYR
jgi:NADH dehydrogenase